MHGIDFFMLTLGILLIVVATARGTFARKKLNVLDLLLIGALLIFGVGTIIAVSYKISNPRPAPSVTAITTTIPNVVTEEYLHRTGTVAAGVPQTVAMDTVYLVVRLDESEKIVGAYAPSTHNAGRPWLAGEKVSIVLLRCELNGQRGAGGTDWFVK